MKFREWILEFKPTILFLVRFLVLYLVSNLVYGLYITAWKPAPDPVTYWATKQTSGLLNLLGWSTHVYDQQVKATAYVMYNDRAIIGVYEGCNGVNVMLIFASFLFAFSPRNVKLLWFIPLGLTLIHLSNLFRIGLLFMVSVKMPDFLFFMHKYLFTAIIYLIVFVLWVWWVMRLNRGPQYASVE